MSTFERVQKKRKKKKKKKGKNNIITLHNLTGI